MVLKFSLQDDLVSELSTVQKGLKKSGSNWLPRQSFLCSKTSVSFRPLGNKFVFKGGDFSEILFSWLLGRKFHLIVAFLQVPQALSVIKQICTNFSYSKRQTAEGKSLTG